MKKNLFSRVSNLIAIGFIPLVIVFHFFVNFITKANFPYSFFERIIGFASLFVLIAIVIALFVKAKKVIYQ